MSDAVQSKVAELAVYDGVLGTFGDLYRVLPTCTDEQSHGALQQEEDMKACISSQWSNKFWQCPSCAVTIVLIFNTATQLATWVNTSLHLLLLKDYMSKLSNRSKQFSLTYVSSTQLPKFTLLEDNVMITSKSFHYKLLLH